LGSVSNGGTYRKNGDHARAVVGQGRAVWTNQSKLSQIARKILLRDGSFTGISLFDRSIECVNIAAAQALLISGISQH
jgi:hypothetical protein